MRSLALRALGSLAFVAFFIALGIARLARVPRPRAEVVARYEDGAVALERVWVGSRAIGYAVRCRGMELLSRPGTDVMRARAATFDGTRWIAVGDTRRVIVLRPDTCAAGVWPGVGQIVDLHVNEESLELQGSAGVIAVRREVLARLLTPVP